MNNDICMQREKKTKYYFKNKHQSQKKNALGWLSISQHVNIVEIICFVKTELVWMRSIKQSVTFFSDWLWELTVDWWVAVTLLTTKFLNCRHKAVTNLSPKSIKWELSFVVTDKPRDKRTKRFVRIRQDKLLSKFSSSNK